MSASIRATGLALLLTGCSVFGQTTGTYEPSVGQAGKDVVWVPTPQGLVDKMLDMAKVTPKDFVMDLGSGDGRTVITAAKRGAHAVGIEFNPDMVQLARGNAQKAGVSERATFLQQDLFKTDLSQATVITMFLLPGINLKRRPKILALKPGTRVVSNTFTMGEWQADQTANADNGCESSWCTALLWIVPAKVAGSWHIPAGEARFEQDFQTLSGTLIASNGAVQKIDGSIKGDRIRFTVGLDTYTGVVRGKEMTGEASGARGGYWQGTRAN